MARPIGFEPTACRLGGDRSILLSYGRKYEIYARYRRWGFPLIFEGKAPVGAKLGAKRAKAAERQGEKPRNYRLFRLSVSGQCVALGGGRSILLSYVGLCSCYFIMKGRKVKGFSPLPVIWALRF